MPRLTWATRGEQREEGEARDRGDDLRHHERQVDDDEGRRLAAPGRVRVVASAAAVATRVETMVAVIGDLQRGQRGVMEVLIVQAPCAYQLRPKPPQRVTERAGVEGEDRQHQDRRIEQHDAADGDGAEARLVAQVEGLARPLAPVVTTPGHLGFRGDAASAMAAPAPCRSCCAHRRSGRPSRRPSGSGPGPSPAASCATSRIAARSDRRSSDACRRPG